LGSAEQFGANVSLAAGKDKVECGDRECNIANDPDDCRKDKSSGPRLRNLTAV
jgi:hypothetical protein